MPLRRRARGASPEVRTAFAAFRDTLALVEEAKARLAAAAPGGRSAGIPLAEALSGFEAGLTAAMRSMSRWRLAEVDAEWSACAGGLDQAAARAEGLRLGRAPEAYEDLYGVLGDLMEPLDSFRPALGRFRELGA